MGWLRGKKDRPNVLGLCENLCWSCGNAVNGCSWSRSFVPVDGWEAEEDGTSYKIRNCPRFERMK